MNKSNDVQKRFVARFSNELFDKLSELASKERRSVNIMLTLILEEYFASRENEIIPDDKPAA